MSVWGHVTVALRLALAHHPLCHWFQADRIQVGRIDVCSGCLATWPAFFLLVPFALGFPVAPAVLAATGILLAAPQMASYVRRAGRAGRFAAKLAGGAGLALLVADILRTPVPWTWRFAALGAVVAGFALLQAIRLRNLLRTCDACPYRRDWESCPGFRASWGPPKPSQAP